jgi:hypothetical protein
VALAATLNVMAASPSPLRRSGVSHAASELTAHVHSREAVTAIVPEPPAGGNDAGEALAVSPQR